MHGGAIAAASSKGNLLQALMAVGREEGLMGYWKGNLPQVRSWLSAGCCAAAVAAIPRHAYMHGFVCAPGWAPNRPLRVPDAF